MYKVNLLPDELTQTAVDLKKVLQAFLFALIVSLVLAVYGFFLYEIHQVKKELALLQKKVADIQPDLQRLESLEKQKADMEKAASDLEVIAGKRMTWSPVLDEINSNVPTDIWLTGLQFINDRNGLPAPEADSRTSQQQAGKVPSPQEVARQIEGMKNTQAEKQGRVDGKQGAPPVAMPAPNAVSIQGESRSVVPVGVFVNRLLTVQYFTDVRVNDIHEDQEKGILAFSLTATLRGGER